MDNYSGINGSKWWLASNNDLYQELFAYVNSLDSKQRMIVTGKH